MHELDAILAARRRAGAAEAVLATVVHVKGSAYRRPGARMLILPDGGRIGSVSGGCLESDLRRKAWWLTEAGRATLRVYDTTSEDDAVWEFGLGCNGVVQVLLERLGSPALGPLLDFLDECRAERREAVVATVIRTDSTSGVEVGERLWLDDGGVRGGNLAGTALEQEVRRRAAAVWRQRSSCLLHSDGTQIFLEWIGMPVSLVVFGAGHDAVPLVAIAKELGWHVTVADGRPAYAKRERLPRADCVVLLQDDQPLGGVDIGREDLVVMMTHNFPQDLQLLPHVLRARPRYLGLLGPIRRTERLFAEAGADVGLVDVHAPVGLDIGADSPEAIALSIVAEIQATLSGRAGGKLRMREGPIHSPVEEVGCREPLSPPPAESLVCAIAAGDD